MRRIAAITAFLAALLALPIAMPSTPSADSTFTVDAIFDTAKGVIPGQTVKIAGARVGSVSDVKLTPTYEARIEMEIDAAFAPFRSDASCEIQPEALVSENFIQCEPGTPDGDELVGSDGHPPTVPLEQTAVPVAFTDLFQIWRVPVRQRLPVIMATLGAGLAGRGEDLNEILRRANPTLELTRRAVSILNRQRSGLAEATAAADEIVGELAARGDDVQSFIEHGDRVTGRIASERDNLASAIEAFPPLLAAAEPALVRLDELTANTTPFLAELRASAPDLRRLMDGVLPAAKAGGPALRELAVASELGLRALDAVEPLTGTIVRFGREALPTGKALGALFQNLRSQGFVENLLTFIYNFAALTARVDGLGHIAPVVLTLNECSQFVNRRLESCNAGWIEGGPGGIIPSPEGGNSAGSDGGAQASRHAEPPAGAGDQIELPELPGVEAPPPDSDSDEPESATPQPPPSLPGVEPQQPRPPPTNLIDGLFDFLFGS